MPRNVKQIIAILGSLALLVALVYGSYLPMRKAQKFLTETRSRESFKSIEELRETFLSVLQFYAPIGQEELVRNTANSILTMVQRSEPAAIKDLMTLIEEMYTPILSRGKGMSFGQNLYLMGFMNEIAHIRTKEPQYLQAARKYFLLALERGPRRPQALYGLLDIARFENNPTAYLAVAEQILSQWPTDEKVRASYEDIKRQLTKKR